MALHRCLDFFVSLKKLGRNQRFHWVLFFETLVSALSHFS